MKSWRGNFQREAPESTVGASSRHMNSLGEVSAPVWVEHTPTPSRDDLSCNEDANSAGRTSGSPPRSEEESGGKKNEMMDRFMSLLPKAWGSSFKNWTRAKDDYDGIEILPNGTRVSPPVSPLPERRAWDHRDGTLHSELQRHSPLEDSLLTSIHPAEYYAEKVEVYNLKYSYLKSWPGLLRLLAGLELLFGGMVFACVVAYLQKDSEWSNAYGLYNGMYNNGLGPSGYTYRGPMTAFTLAVAGLSWIITLCLLVTGLTMYYRTILLDSPWWPLTEAFINVALFLLYMAAGIVYLNDLNRGGLCHMTIGVNPMLGSLCRVDGGQMAGTAFIFINMLMYLVSFLVSLKMWRHETTRKERERFMMEEEYHQSIPLAPTNARKMVFKGDMNGSGTEKHVNKQANIHFAHEAPGRLQDSALAPGYDPGVQVVADYIVKYPEIGSLEERERYKAVFNDQYQEYKDLHRDITTALNKFQELDTIMAKLLLRNGNKPEERKTIQRILKQYEKKKSDPSFLEKRERYNYMKAKLSHVKNRIRSFDTAENHNTRR